MIFTLYVLCKLKFKLTIVYHCCVYLQLQSVFLCLEKILLRIADDLGKYYQTGQAVVRKLLTSNSNLLHNTLNMKNK